MRTSVTVRLIFMTFLALALLIPLAWVWEIVAERATRRDDAAREIGATWGGAQYVAGPVIAVPYTVPRSVDAAGHPDSAIRTAMFLPQDLQIDGSLRAETRSRGIFDVIVYHVQLHVKGRFPALDVSDIQRAESIDWGHATLNVGVSDPRGLTQRTTVKWNGRDVPMTGGVADLGLFSAGLRGDLPALDPLSSAMPFEFTLDLNGTRELWFVPTAQQTDVQLEGTWPHPSFSGRALPETRQITPAGFTARWRMQDFARPFASRWTSAGMNREQLSQQANASAFGLLLVQPVDIYQQTERAVKYAALFIVLTFLVFFLWEIFHASLLHPVQYAFVGFALCVFYLLLVSLSEHVGFDPAYAIAAGATVALITGYARSILRGTRPALSVLAALATLYGFLYLLLRLEDYALLAGSVGLFIVLAAVMFITRRMNWYDLRLGDQPR
jgi:inner membrane protein